MAWPLLLAVPALRAADPAMEEHARRLKDAFARFETERKETLAALDASEQARIAAEAEARDAKARIQKLETQSERLAALLAQETDARKRDREARAALEKRVDELDRILHDTTAERDRLQTDLERQWTERRADAERIRELQHDGGAAPAATSVPDVAAPAMEGEPDAKPSWERVRTESDRGNFDGAAALAYVLAKDRRPRAAQWALLGEIEQKRGRLDASVEAWEQAVRREPKNIAYVKHLALIDHAAGKLDDAIKQFSRVTELNEEDGEAHFNLAVLYLISPHADLKEAANHYQRALRLGESRDENLEKMLFR